MPESVKEPSDVLYRGSLGSLDVNEVEASGDKAPGGLEAGTRASVAVGLAGRTLKVYVNAVEMVP